MDKIAQDYFQEKFTDEQFEEFKAIYEQMLIEKGMVDPKSKEFKLTEDFFDEKIDEKLLQLGLDEDSIKIVEKIKNQSQDLNNDNHIDFDEFKRFCTQSISIFNEIDIFESAFISEFLNHSSRH